MKKINKKFKIKYYFEKFELTKIININKKISKINK